ncbi:MAG: family efflux transporter permease subunit [Burkholderiales bacterium]|jgi:EmrB/QacA subfamily drug resistance transporter|nr:family efflux transporter permease subunit [Burkholderiales bacterium]
MNQKIINNSQKYWVLAGVSIASFLGCIDFTIVNTALPAIQAGFAVDIAMLQWVINIFLLALSAFMVLAGRMADIYGRRKMLYIGLSLFGLSSLFAGLSTSILQLLICRFVQGFSCTILYTATGAIISSTFTTSERGRAMGILFGVNALGLAVGPVLGGLIAGALSWRWIFFVNIPFTLLSLMICVPNISESYGSKNSKIDILGAITLILGLSSLVLGFTQADSWGWASKEILGLFGFTSIMAILFYIIEHKVAEPIIKFDLFINRKFIISMIATSSMAFFYCITFFLIPLYLHNVRGDNTYLIGLTLLPVTATIALLSPVIGRYVDRHGAKNVLLCGFIFFALSAFMQANFNNINSIFFVLLALVSMGIGWACVLGPSTVLALASLPESSSALAMGASWTLHNIGGVVGLGIGLAVYYAEFTAYHSFMAGYKNTMYLLLAVSILTLLAISWNFYKAQANPK